MVRVSRVLDPGSSATLVLELKFITEARIVSAQLNLNKYTGFLTRISDDMVDGRIYFRSTSLLARLRSTPYGVVVCFAVGKKLWPIDASVLLVYYVASQRQQHSTLLMC